MYDAGVKDKLHRPPITLTAYRADEEPHRIERLQEVAMRCPRLVIGLHDHKSCLSVNWSEPPMTAELIAVIDAWADQGEHDFKPLSARPLVCRGYCRLSAV